MRVQFAGDDPQQGGLAGAVRTDQGRLGALAYAEPDVVQEHPAVRELVTHTGDFYMAHPSIVLGTATGLRGYEACP